MKGLPSALFEVFRTSLSVRCPPALIARKCQHVLFIIYVYWAKVSFQNFPYNNIYCTMLLLNRALIVYPLTIDGASINILFFYSPRHSPSLDPYHFLLAQTYILVHLAQAFTSLLKTNKLAQHSTQHLSFTQQLPQHSQPLPIILTRVSSHLSFHIRRGSKTSQISCLNVALQTRLR